MDDREGLVLTAPPVRPLSGFTWRGWCALAVFLLLAAAAWSGWDPNLLAYRLWAALFGGDGLMWFCIYVFIYPRLVILDPMLTLVTAFVGTIALWIQPGRYPLGRAAALWGSAWLLAQLPIVLFGPLKWTVDWLVLPTVGPSYLPAAAMLVAGASAAVLWWVFRSKLVAIVALAAAAAGIVHVWVFSLVPAGGQAATVLGAVSTGILWQIVVGASMIGVAVFRRRRAPRGDGPWCARCGYPIHSTEAQTCPECGASLGRHGARQATNV